MKTKLLLVPLLLITGMVWGQVINGENITIDANVSIENIESNVKKGDYKLRITNMGNVKAVTILKNATLAEPFSLDNSEKSKPQPSSDYMYDLSFDKNTTYTINIISEDAPKERKYVLKSQSNWEWTTTFGGNAVVFTNRSKFASAEKEGVHTVAEIQDRKSIELMPAIMFTFMNNHKDISFGYTGGIGFNFEELALFTGLSLGIGQNIVLTGGVAVHKQNRPNSDYYIGQVIENTITTDDLNQKQYRFNPFLGLSFRLDSNPFKSK